MALFDKILFGTFFFTAFALIIIATWMDQLFPLKVWFTWKCIEGFVDLIKGFYNEPRNTQTKTADKSQKT